MHLAARLSGSVVALLAAGLTGCHSGPQVSRCETLPDVGAASACQAGPDCQAGPNRPGRPSCFGGPKCSGGPTCEGGPNCRGGLFAQSAGGDSPCRWSDEWYAEAAQRPAGARQVHHHGKLWPPYPRPTEEGQEFCQKFHTAHYWPHPYICWDRAYVETVLGIQAANGWIAECTLHAHHFDAVTHELDHAGRLQLRWILENAPPKYRFVWVETARNNEISTVRLANVRNAAYEMVGNENVPPIMLRVGALNGRPAGEINEIRQRELKTIPEPRIEYTAPTVGAGGG